MSRFQLRGLHSNINFLIYRREGANEEIRSGLTGAHVAQYQREEVDEIRPTLKPVDVQFPLRGSSLCSMPVAFSIII